VPSFALTRPESLTARQDDEQHSHELLKRSESASQRAEQIQETFDWTVQTVKLISRLDHRLSWTIEAWERFNAADGDFRYFCGIHSMPNLSQQRAHLYLPEIKETYKRLKALHRDLVNLENMCDKSMKLVRVAPMFTPGSHLSPLS